MFIIFGLGISLVYPQCGDVDGSGQVDAEDLMIIANYLGERDPKTWMDRFSFKQGDINGDGKLNINDLLLLRLYLADVTDQMGCRLNAGDLFAADSILGALRFVPAGTFVQGSPDDEPCHWMWICNDDEIQFVHTLTRDLAVMETEATRFIWERLREVQPALPPDPSYLYHTSGMNDPVQFMFWCEALLFANLLSRQQGYSPCYFMDHEMTEVLDESNYKPDDYLTCPYYCDFDASGYRLPTEGEWEYFCRAGTTGPFWIEEPNYSQATCDEPYCVAGEFSILEQAAWFCANYAASPVGAGSTSPVKQKKPNPWGLYDIHGNVSELCWDWIECEYPSGSATDYQGPPDGEWRSGRGGAWASFAHYIRSAHRRYYIPNNYVTIGFRLVRTIPR